MRIAFRYHDDADVNGTTEIWRYGLGLPVEPIKSQATGSICFYPAGWESKSYDIGVFDEDHPMNSHIIYNVSMSASNNVAARNAFDVTTWGGCSEDCGWGTKNRTAVCRDPAGAVVTDCGFQISTVEVCFVQACKYSPITWDDSLKNDSVTVWKVGDTAALKWTGGVEDGYAIIRLYHLHGELKNELNEMNSHLEALDPLIGTEFSGKVLYQGPNIYKNNWIIPATLLPSRRYLLELEATNSQYYKLGYASSKIHISIQGASSYEFKWIASQASAAAIVITIEDDYDRMVNVNLDGPHTAGTLMTKTLSVDLGEIREIKTTSTMLESVLITSSVTGFVGVYGFRNITGDSSPSCYVYPDCRTCGYSTNCGWCDSRKLCLPLAVDGKTWSKVVECIADPLRPNGFWNPNGCIDYTNCTNTGSVNGATTGSATTGSGTTGAATGISSTTKKNAGNTLQYGIALLLALLSILF